MAITRVQGGHGNSGASSVSSVSGTAAATFGSGNAVVGVVSYNSAVAVSSVTDDKGNTYNLETSILDSGNSQRAIAFSLGNITNGPKTITANMAGATNALSIAFDEYSGISAVSDPRDGSAHGGQTQPTPGTGSNGVLSGTFTTTANGDLVVGLYAGTAGQNATITAGTTTLTYTNGTNDNGTPNDAELQTEWAVQTTAASGTQTSFTQSVAGATICFLIALQAAPTVGGGGGPFPRVYQRFRPRRIGPFRTPLMVLSDIPVPVSQDDWPLPRTTTFRADFNWLNNNSTIPLLAVAPQPFGQDSWPVPVTAVSRIDVNWLNNNATIPLLATPAVTVMPGQYDYPPPTPPPTVFAKSYSSPYALTVVVGPPNTQDDWPIPKTTRPAFYAQNYAVPYPLLSIASTPFSQDVWPVPIQPGRVYAEARRADIGLLHSVQPPNGQDDWPVPKRVPSFFYAQNYSTPYPLLSVVPAPFVQSSWPTPVTAVSRIDSSWLNNNSTIPLLAPPTVVMPGQYDYPLPLQSAPVYAQSYSSPYALTAVAVVAPPISQDDWPLPKRAPSFFYAQNYSVPYPLLSVASTPFAQDVWPAPVQLGRVYAEARRADIQLLHSVQPPNSQTSWPTPTPPYRVYAQSYSTPATVLTAPLPPIAQYDWPIPKQPYRVYADVRRADIQLLHSVQPPNSLSDWPLPTQPGRVYAKSYSTPATVLTAPLPPIMQTSWPVPVQPARVYAEARRADIGLLHSVKPPNRALDWPNPKLALQPTSAQTWIQRSLDTIAPAAPSLMPGQYDYPNPSLGEPARVRAQSYSSPETLLQPPAAMPIAQMNWPVPTQPARVYAEARRADIRLLLSVKPPNRQSFWPLPIVPERRYQPSAAKVLVPPVAHPRSHGYIIA